MPEPQEMSLWAPITKFDSATRLIEGPISGLDNMDLDQQIVDSEWLRRAVGPWAKYGNIREQHNPQRPVGKATTVDAEHPSGVPHIVAKIVDNDAWAKVEAGIYSGFSVGIKNARIVKDKNAPKGRIIGGDLIEVSIVDHPSNTNAKFAICKSVGGGGWQDLQTGAVIEPVVLETSTEKSATPMPIQHAAHAHGTFTHVHTFEAGDHAHCPTCGDDMGCCGCSAEQKAAGSFTDTMLSTPPLHPDHNVPASTHAPESQGDFSGEADGVNQQNVMIKELKAAIDRMEAALKGGNHFNPNQAPNTSGTNGGPIRKLTPPTPAADTTWHGAHPATATPQLPKSADGLTEEMVYKTALEACSDFFGSLLEENGTLAKGAALEVDFTKAVFIDVVKAAVATVTSDFSERLAQVENIAMPSKPYGYVPAVTAAVEKNFNLNPVTTPVAHSAVDAIVAALTEEQKFNAAKHFLSGVHQAGPGAYSPQ